MFDKQALTAEEVLFYTLPMKLRSVFSHILFTVTITLSLVACDKKKTETKEPETKTAQEPAKTEIKTESKTEVKSDTTGGNPCPDLIASMKKCPGTEEAVVVIEKSCTSSFQALELQDKAMATEFSNGIQECSKKEKCDDINSCMRPKMEAFAKKMMEKANVNASAEKPTDVKPADVKPADVKPADAKPADTTVESPCAELAAVVKKLPNGEPVAGPMQQSCESSLKSMADVNKDAAAAYSEGLKACVKKEKLEEIGPCMAEAAQKAAAKFTK